MSGPSGNTPGPPDDVHSPFGHNLRPAASEEESTSHQGVEYTLESAGGEPTPAPAHYVVTAPPTYPATAPVPAQAQEAPRRSSGGGAWIVGGLVGGVALLLGFVGLIVVLDGDDDAGDEATYAYQSDFCESFDPEGLDEGMTLEESADRSNADALAGENTGVVECAWQYGSSETNAYLQFTAKVFASGNVADAKRTFDDDSRVAEGTTLHRLDDDWDEGMLNSQDEPQLQITAVTRHEHLVVEVQLASTEPSNLAYDESEAHSRVEAAALNVRQGLQA